MAPKKINIKERESEGEIDLSMSDLQDVPVRDIAVFKKAYSLDLSNNHLTLLPSTFPTLTHITKLDLSKNHLTELPENFGDLAKLKYLDLYQNQLEHLPLSFSKFKALRWLDLKDNPLVSAVAKVAGPCLDSRECQTCAKDVVNFFTKVQEQVANDLESRQKDRQKQLAAAQQKATMDKKAIKKKSKPKTVPPKEAPKVAVAAKKSKKNAPAAKAGKSCSSCKCVLTLSILVFLALFILTSIHCEYTRNVEVIVTKVYQQAVGALPPNLQVYPVQAGSYVKQVHEKTGNLTLGVVHFVKTNEQFVNLSNSLCTLVKDLRKKAGL